ncbi:NADPH:quinone oxidoreductase family protein [Roseovarius dicentrarchi]|uniref:NADPH:quinone oxidoreductase family protein n=1 Tax=Roseovarius dicentrarchi TaxID=2250573 RepID=UPI000DE93890|nr:NADPH:quinone oxidoreductase family protein [Roseovarius dicentrarchi]
MRALRLTAHDTPPALTECPVPDPAPGQIRLRIHACGLNFADLLMIKGSYQDMPPLPFTMGMEVAGTVDALGAGVEGPAIGTRVAVYGGHGGLAEYGCFDASRATPLPDALTFEAAAAFQIAYGTSHLALEHRARLRPGETLLVLGAAGGVGLTAVEIGKAMGARVIACARGAAKLDAARAAGADHLIDAETDDIRQMTKDLGGADVVYDPVGGDQFTAAFRACRPEARILSIGFASGDIPQIPANHLLVKNVTVMGLYWGGYLTFAPDLVTQSLRTLLNWAADGRIRPRAHHTYPLARTLDALDLLRTRQSTGKVVITM